MHPIALTIAGSDSGGGAGIQADLKTFQMQHVYGCSVITAITAQNTCGVQAVQLLEPSMIQAQIRSIQTDIPVDAIKIGMLGNATIISSIAQELVAWKQPKLVLDPVMIAKGGASLLEPSAVNRLINELVPHATLVTPNIPEAEILTQCSIHTLKNMQQAAETWFKHTNIPILIKGGHLHGPPTDLFFNGYKHHWLHAERIDTKHTHGTGCSYAAAITAYLAHGKNLWEAIQTARKYIQGAITHAYTIGGGQSPIAHAWQYTTFSDATMHTY